MSYVTRSGRRTRKVNYSDNPPRSTSRSTTPKQIITQQSDKENESNSESEIEIISSDNNNNMPTIEPPQKKQKISHNTSTITCNKPTPQKRKRRRPIRKKKTPISPNTNTNNIPPLIPSNTNINRNIIIPPLPSINKLKSKPKRRVRKKIISKQESDSSDSSSYSSSDSELEILKSKPISKKKKKRILPTFKPSPIKKKKPKKKPKKIIEKRSARKRKITQKVRDRISRARNQRLFMINATEIDTYTREYAVLGSTGNVYTITISELNDCTCPDYGKGNVCKHILFIMLKVLRVSSSSEYIYQKGLLKSELYEIFNNAPRTLFGSVLANDNVRELYNNNNNNNSNNNNNNVIIGKVKRKELIGNECAVCMEDFDGKEDTTYCKAQCGNNIHVECFNEWCGAQERNGEDVTCMYCRAKWIYDNNEKKNKKKKSKKKKYNEGYLNLANEQGISRVRDTSTYYKSGWNGYGKRYGYKRRYWGGW